MARCPQASGPSGEPGRFGPPHAHHAAGCTGRLGACHRAELGEHPLIETREACLLKRQGLRPVHRGLPGGSAQTNGFERRRCWQRLKDNRAAIDYFFDLPRAPRLRQVCRHDACSSAIRWRLESATADAPSRFGSRQRAGVATGFTAARIAELENSLSMTTLPSEALTTRQSAGHRRKTRSAS